MNKDRPRVGRDTPKTLPSHAQPLDHAFAAMTLFVVASVLVSVALGVPWLSPVLQTAAIFPFYRWAMRRHLYQRSIALILRWSILVLASMLIVGGFVPDRLLQSAPLASHVVAGIHASLDVPAGPPPANWSYLIWGMLGFLVVTAASGGLLGMIVLSVALGCAASGALLLFRHGTNVIEVTLVALPPWQWSALAAAGLLLVPVALPVFGRLHKTERVAEERAVLRRYVLAGAALFVLSLLLRLVAAGLWHDLIRAWTIFD